jgi:hypothetical protein
VEICPGCNGGAHDRFNLAINPVGGKLTLKVQLPYFLAK